MTFDPPENGVTAELRAARMSKRTGMAARSLLPSPAPPPGSSRDIVRAWLTAALSLAADPIETAERFGRHPDARLVIVLTSGRRVTFERTADAFEPKVLVRVVMIATGTQIQPYPAPDALLIAGSIIRLAELRDESDDRDEAREWGRGFLHAADRNTYWAAEFSTPAGRYEVVAGLASWKVPADVSPSAPVAERSPIVAVSATGDRIVRTSDFARHARGEHPAALSWPALHGRMSEVGWDHLGEVHVRQPGGHRRVKAHIYRVPKDWEGE